MKPLTALLLATLPLAAPHAVEGAPALSKRDLLSWPAARADRFGCFLERTFHHQDPRFHCPKKQRVRRGRRAPRVEVARADMPAGGPAFPAARVRAVHPLVTAIELQWERGRLQAVVVRLDRKLTADEVWSVLELPRLPDPFHPNVMDVLVEDCGASATCVRVLAFDQVEAAGP